MRVKLCSALLAGGLVALAGAVAADQPRPLTEAEMDTVNAGAIAIAVGGSLTFGDLLSETISQSVAVAEPTAASAANSTAGVAVSTFFGASSTSASTSAATLP